METQESAPSSPAPPMAPTTIDLASCDPITGIQPLGNGERQDFNCKPTDEGSPPVNENVSVPSDAASQYNALLDKIVRQVEYYFSDENLPNDKFLLKKMRKDKDGYVPLTVIASFIKVKKLTKDLSIIEAAMRTSSLIVLSSDGKMVKRLHPLPLVEARDVNPQTVLVENLPEDHSEDNIRRIFGRFGHIVEVVIHNAHSEEAHTATKWKKSAISRKLHALIVYDTIKAAESAVLTLNDENNWSGMQVQLLLKRMEKYGKYGLSKNVRNVVPLEKKEKNLGAEVLEISATNQDISEKEEKKLGNGGLHCQPTNDQVPVESSFKRNNEITKDIIKAAPQTVLVENLPEDYSEENIRRIFGTVGHILEVTIHDPRLETESATDNKEDSAISWRLHALVEYDTVKAAETVVSTCNTENNWSGMQVQYLSKRMVKYGKYGLSQSRREYASPRKSAKSSGTHALGNSASNQGGLEKKLSIGGGKNGRRRKKTSRRNRDFQPINVQVPVTVSASVLKMKKLPRNMSVIKAAKKTVIVENLPEDHSEDNIRKIFGKPGRIVEVAIHDPHSDVASATPNKPNSAISRKLHALIDYDTVKAAESAVSSLNDEDKWNGMRVQLLSKRMAKYGKYGISLRGRKRIHRELFNLHKRRMTRQSQRNLYRSRRLERERIIAKYEECIWDEFYIG